VRENIFVESAKITSGDTERSRVQLLYNNLSRQFRKVPALGLSGLD